MKIGVDATCLQNKRGYGRHARGLLGTLARMDQKNSYVFIIDSEDHLGSLPEEVEVRLVRSSKPTVVATSASGHRAARDMWRISRAMSSPDFDLLFFPTIYSYVPIITRAKKVVMIHDVIPEKYPQLTLPTRTARLFWNTKVTLGCWQADAIVTISDYSRRGILDHLKIPSEQVFVIGEATDSIFRVIDDPRPTPRLEALGIATNDRTVVYVGGFGPHKNLEILIRALANLTTGEEFSDLRLVMVGEYQNEVFHSHFSAIKSRVEELGVGQRVSFTGYLPDEELVILLNTSTVLVLPSLMEGFGLPAIEAMACGCPVIATTESPLSAILGEAALYIDPRKPEDLERALMRLLRSVELRRKMRAAGIAAAQRLTWEKAAQEMIDVFSHVVNR